MRKIHPAYHHDPTSHFSTIHCLITVITVVITINITMHARTQMGWNAMTLAALKGNTEALDLLIKAGVIVDCVDGMGYDKQMNVFHSMRSVGTTTHRELSRSVNYLIDMHIYDISCMIYRYCRNSPCTDVVTNMVYDFLLLSLCYWCCCSLFFVHTTGAQFFTLQVKPIM